MPYYTELRCENLLVRRPHFQLRGNDLFWIGSKEPLRRLSAPQAALWNLLQRPVSLQDIREACGESADVIVREFLRSAFCELLEPAFPRDRRRVIVIEPHADDAALSIGGTMWLRRLECEFVIATMASRSNHTRFRDLGSSFFDVREATEIRRLESELFARLIGGTYVPLGLADSDLRYHDANWTADFFRRHRMSIRIASSRIANDQERERWTDAVKRLLREQQSAEVWFPLGGPHTDHLLTADACFAAFQSDPSLVRGRVLRLYSEFPYAIRYPQQMDDALVALRNSGAVLEEVPSSIGNVREQKLHLVSVYDSQDIVELCRDTESGGLTRGSAGQAEALWTLRGLPNMIDQFGLLSAATINRTQVEAATAWASRNRDAARVRVLLLMPTGQWATDLELLCAAFPDARFEVFVTTAAAAEVTDAASDRVDVRNIDSGFLAWILLGLRISAAAKPLATLFYVGRRRLNEARLLSRLWLGSDTLIVETMNSVASALRVSR